MWEFSVNTYLGTNLHISSFPPPPPSSQVDLVD